MSFEKQTIAGEGADQGLKIDDNRETSLKEGWEFWCCPSV